MSKRKFLRLVNEGHVKGWDDPRMPTLSGLRRRGYPPAAIREFAARVGLSKRESMIDLDLLEFCVREELNRTAPRYMAVLDPLKVILTNYPQGQSEILEAENNPEDPNAGSRKLSFGRELYIERDDFMEEPPKKYFRLAPGAMVRLKNAYIIRCDEVVKNEAGEIEHLLCSYVENSRSGEDTSGIKVKGTIHWVDCASAKAVNLRNYDRLFSVPDLNEHPDTDFIELLNPQALVEAKAWVEPALFNCPVGQTVQFIRKGYYCVDEDSTATERVFNLTVNLKDSWAKAQQKA